MDSRDELRNESSRLRQGPDWIVDRDVSIEMDDGIVLRADVFRPRTDKRVPVVLTMGPYGKGVSYQDGYRPQWDWLIKKHWEILRDSTGSYLTWETVDPEVWVPSGYAVVRVDSRGAGRSPGIMDVWSLREAKDLFSCIEWAGKQPWTNGKVGLCGISYYAENQWWVAPLKPPHLAAMIAWEGANDYYREITHHGGILSNVFWEVWYPRQILSVQHGKGANGYWDHWLKDWASGPETLSDADLKTNRTDNLTQNREHYLDDEYHHSRTPDFSKIEVPFLSAANWGGFGLHERGNFEAFTQSASKEKWLEVHGGRHEEAFYLPYAVEMQMRFFDHYLKGIDNGWAHEPPVLLWVRYIDHFEQRKEREWPLDRTDWTKAYLVAETCSLSYNEPGGKSSRQFDALGEGLTFLSSPLDKTTEITGPLAARLFVSSSTTDADLFLTLRAFDPGQNEVDFQGTLDPHTPLAQGWLRASHRKLDSVKSKPYRPYHPHDVVQPIEPKSIYELNVEIWPTCIVLPANYRLGLTIGGIDFERRKGEGEFGVPLRGSGPFLHNDPHDRPPSIFGGKTTIHTGGDHLSYVLLPIIPSMR